ncbi:hypothetical protein FTX61_08120 [Nitriliruptoraceae bacterium ZYF776]|nr:hypothetical protein [Profundirhabdus halotolerans]
MVATRQVTTLVLDIEPYLLADWHTPATTRRRLVERFVGTLTQAEARAGDVRVVAAAPFWFDEHPASSGSGTVLDQVARAVDGLLVMAYRDTPERVLATLDDERRVAAATSTDLWVALELTPQDPASITFHEEGRAAVDAALASHPTYRGTVLHTLEAYAAMPRPTAPTSPSGPAVTPTEPAASPSPAPSSGPGNSAKAPGKAKKG